MTAWTNLVKEKFRLGRMVNPTYSLKQAMKSAKKVYRTTVSSNATSAKKTTSRKSSSKKTRRKGTRRKGTRRKGTRRK